jgi:uncharacterized protein YndB with AHSA1/START domain
MTTDLAVSKTITVAAPQERAFTVFTEQIASWWPLENYTIGAQPAATVVMEARAGGRWFERAADGTECQWGRVLAWEPPDRVVLAWQISSEWTADPRIESEVEVRFVAEAPRRTRVELTHRNLATFGDQAEQMRQIFDSEGGWTGLLAHYSKVVERPPVAGARGLRA